MYVNQIIGFNYLGYVYQWDHKLGGFTPNGAIPSYEDWLKMRGENA